MIAIRIVCAWDSVEKAHAMERLLVAEGYVVSVACGLASLSDIEERAGAPECVVCVWSVDGAESYFVWRWVEATDPSAIVEIRLNEEAPAIDTRREDPIDFTRWRGDGDRGADCWKELERRIRRVATGEMGPRVEPVRAAIAVGAVAMLALGASAGLRLVDGLTDDRNVSPSPATASAALEQDQPVHHMGGLEASVPLMEPEDADELDHFQRRRLVLARPLAPSPGGDALARVSMADPITFRNRTLMDHVTAPFRSNDDS